MNFFKALTLKDKEGFLSATATACDIKAVKKDGKVMHDNGTIMLKE
jgi:hypothetical protein